MYLNVGRSVFIIVSLEAIGMYLNVGHSVFSRELLKDI